MKPVFKAAGLTVLLYAVLAAGCVKVDRDYDFSKLNDGTIVVGDVFRAPLANITFSIDDIFDDLDAYVSKLGFDPLQIGEVPIPLNITSELKYDIGEPIGESIYDMINSDGTLTLMVSGENSMPVYYGITLRFVDYRGAFGEPGNIRFSLDPIEVQPAADGQPAKVEAKIGLTQEQLELICFSDGIWVELTSSVSNVVFNRGDNLRVALQLEKIGGIEIDGIN